MTDKGSRSGWRKRLDPVGRTRLKTLLRTERSGVVTAMQRAFAASGDSQGTAEGPAACGCQTYGCEGRAA